jgi:glycerol-3-phosphate O-acyltransferase/dihydroxyacetone phosphate acyltransferase
VRTGKLAARIYAPLGTRMSLGDYVRVVRTFLDAFKASEDNHDVHDDPQEGEKGGTDAMLDTERVQQLRRDLKVSYYFIY